MAKGGRSNSGRTELLDKLTVSATENEVRILYSDDDYVLVYKPVKMAVHRSFMSQDDTYLLQIVRDLTGRFVYPVHRLDRATSGIVVFALSAEAHAALAARFAAGEVSKSYLAVCRGWPQGSGHIDHPLKRLDQKGHKLADAEPQASLTEYRLIHQFELPKRTGKFATSRYAICGVTLHTGRRHQIRRHFAHISHHLIGDTTYGKGVHNRLFRNELDISRLLLMATAISFVSPVSNREISVELSPDEDFLRLMKL